MSNQGHILIMRIMEIELGKSVCKDLALHTYALYAECKAWCSDSPMCLNSGGPKLHQPHHPDTPRPIHTRTLATQAPTFQPDQLAGSSQPGCPAKPTVKTTVNFAVQTSEMYCERWGENYGEKAEHTTVKTTVNTTVNFPGHVFHLAGRPPKVLMMLADLIKHFFHIVFSPLFT